MRKGTYGRSLNVKKVLNTSTKLNFIINENSGAKYITKIHKVIDKLS